MSLDASAIPTPLMHGIAGALANTLSIVLLYPLDQIRTIQQAASSRNSGVSLSHLLSLRNIPSLYQGIGASVEALLVSYFVFFFAFAYFRRSKLQFSGRSRPTPFDNLVSSMAAGILNVLMTSPLWVYSTTKRLGSTSRGESFLGFVMGREKWSDLWKGTAASLWLVGNPVVHFVVYESGRLALLSRTQPARQRGFSAIDDGVSAEGVRVLTDRQAMVLGGLAKFTATMATYPLQSSDVEEK
ncbi:hypothetical protein FOL47_002899 [Perkinsus chesapeaki]|uniref:Uncharacterized protein n=1 Tax=Perkinsus chesapeaki TaxID=330153 RepID=A0A7J6MB23_PERCH|nr:hypothetical protein FOL47_002899 [Perkinsus chesapeaki]